MCVKCVWVCRRLGVRGGVAYSMPVIAFNGSTRTHTHVPFLYLPRLICPSTVYLSVSVFCVCTQHSPFSNTHSISFSWHSENPLLFEGKSITAVVFWCWLSSLLCLRSEFTYVCGNDNTPTQHTDSHTQHTHTQRCAHKWINWRAAWWPVTINEPLTSKKKGWLCNLWW